MAQKLTALQVDLSLSGMSCNACAMTIEKGLNKIAGVEATVNFATESARVNFSAESTSTPELIETVKSLGYSARLLEDTTAEMIEAEVDERVAMLLTRMTASIVCGIPVVLISMIANLQFKNWQWLALALSAPVVTWGAWPFHRAALMNARHRSTPVLGQTCRPEFGCRPARRSDLFASDPGLRCSRAILQWFARGCWRCLFAKGW